MKKLVRKVCAPGIPLLKSANAHTLSARPRIGLGWGGHGSDDL